MYTQMTNSLSNNKLLSNKLWASIVAHKLWDMVYAREYACALRTSVKMKGSKQWMITRLKQI